MSDKKPTVTTKEELKALIADRANDHQHPDLTYQPNWMLDASDEIWDRLRKRERKIRRMTTRLDKARKKFENDFDMNS